MSAPRFDGLSDLARNRAPDNPLLRLLTARTRRGVPMSMCVHPDSVSYMPYRRRGDWIKIKAAARAAGLSDYIVFSRLRNGWTLEKALNTPVRTVRTRTHKRSSGSRFDARGVESAH